MPKTDTNIAAAEKAVAPSIVIEVVPTVKSVWDSEGTPVALNEIDPGEILRAIPGVFINHPSNPRDREEYEGGAGLQPLVASIRAGGISTPVQATRITPQQRFLFPDLDEAAFENLCATKLMLLSGHRRRAAYVTATRTDGIPFYLAEDAVDGKSLEEQFKGMMAANTDSRDIGFVGRIRGYINWSAMRRLLGQGVEASVRSIAAIIGVPKTGVGRLKQVVELLTSDNEQAVAVGQMFMNGSLGEALVPTVSLAVKGSGIARVHEVLTAALAAKAKASAIEKMLRPLCASEATANKGSDSEDDGYGDPGATTKPSVETETFAKALGLAVDEVNGGKGGIILTGNALSVVFELLNGNHENVKLVIGQKVAAGLMEAAAEGADYGDTGGDDA